MLCYRYLSLSADQTILSSKNGLLCLDFVVKLFMAKIFGIFCVSLSVARIARDLVWLRN